MSLFLSILRPYEICFSFSCGQFEPKSSFDNASDEFRVISRTYKNFINFFGVSVGVSWKGQIHINWVGEINFVQELN